MKRKLSTAKSVSPEDLMTWCGSLANEVGLTEETRVYFADDDHRDPKAGWLAGWAAPLNADLQIEIDSILRDDEDEAGPHGNGRLGDPLKAIWSVTVWPTPEEDDDKTITAVVEVHDLPFSEALRFASAIIQTHKFKKS